MPRTYKRKTTPCKLCGKPINTDKGKNSYHKYGPRKCYHPDCNKKRTIKEIEEFMAKENRLPKATETLWQTCHRRTGMSPYNLLLEEIP